MGYFDPLAWCVAALALLPLAVLATEWAAALTWRPGGTRGRTGERPSVAVLIPAHDEEAGLPATLRSVLPQLRLFDRVLVVADNCSDATADVARSFGVGVLERTDPVNRGKGFALDAGVRCLAAEPPDVVVVLDADCLLGPGALDRLAAAAEEGRPAQAAYLMLAPKDAGPARRLAAFAFLVKNLARPLGLRRLGLPCLLTGTGMAFPWEAVRTARLASGNLVEDMQLAVDLTANGRPPVFVPDAQVTAEFPVGDAAARSQRKRWEHGHLRTLLTQVPRLAWAGLRRGRPALLGLAAETGVPPLSLVVLGTLAALAILAGEWLAGGSAWPAVTLATGAALATGLLGLVWLRFGREVLPARATLAVPAYILGKMPLYLGFLVRPQRDWVRTPREGGQANSAKKM